MKIVPSKDLDTIYVTASARDGRFTRICVASIRYFYPNVRIKLLAGGPLEDGLFEELARYWNVSQAIIPSGDWGWGFIKLEPLFSKVREKFLILDSDTAFAGPVLQTWQDCSSDFLFDYEKQTEDQIHRLYYDWRKVSEVDPTARPPLFVANTGQWFGTSGLIRREDFEPFIDWSTSPPRLRHPDLFMPGEQGVLNFVINKKIHYEGLRVDLKKIMCWPGHGMEGISVPKVSKKTAPPLIVHWAGMKRARLRNMPGYDILHFFEEYYYLKIANGMIRKYTNCVRYLARFLCHNLKERILFHLEMKNA